MRGVRMKVIIDIPEDEYNEWGKNIKNAIPIPDNATPCDFCRYNPPSSTDGKPCCMCPATPYQKGGK